jgi:hypothetical protein
MLSNQREASCPEAAKYALKAINLDNCKFVTHGSLFAKASALAELDQEARSGANLTRSSEPASWIA